MLARHQDTFSLGDLVASAQDAALAGAKGAAMGCSYGALTPFNLRAGWRHMRANQENLDQHFARLLVDYYAQAFTLVAHAGLAYEAFSRGYGRAYAATILASNIASGLLSRRHGG